MRGSRATVGPQCKTKRNETQEGLSSIYTDEPRPWEDGEHLPRLPAFWKLPGTRQEQEGAHLAKGKPALFTNSASHSRMCACAHARQSTAKQPDVTSQFNKVLDRSTYKRNWTYNHQQWIYHKTKRNSIHKKSTPKWAGTPLRSKGPLTVNSESLQKAEEIRPWETSLSVHSEDELSRKDSTGTTHRT